jgi:hypothetical protein
MFEMQTQQPVLMISAIYVGPEGKGMVCMQPFVAQNPLRQSVSVLP